MQFRSAIFALIASRTERRPRFAVYLVKPWAAAWAASWTMCGGVGKSGSPISRRSVSGRASARSSTSRIPEGRIVSAARESGFIERRRISDIRAHQYRRTQGRGAGGRSPRECPGRASAGQIRFDSASTDAIADRRGSRERRRFSAGPRLCRFALAPVDRERDCKAPRLRRRRSRRVRRRGRSPAERPRLRHRRRLGGPRPRGRARRTDLERPRRRADLPRLPRPHIRPRPVKREGRPEPREAPRRRQGRARDRKSTRLNSSHVKSSYAVFCLKKKKKTKKKTNTKKKKNKKSK